MEAFTSVFKDLVKEAVAKSTAVKKVTEDNVFQEGNAEIVPYLDKMVEALTLPGSGISGMENIRKLFGLLKEGRPCLLLLEHYSNLDYSLFHYFLR
ncbi:MAG: 1-acyl-sn-glycerol-3-phosphate acyltransferase, partial [Treponema sp.]|nr:1-acyl-sn-glycerol-3-phosphate acyltransferase [Treponema sp.]